MGQKKLGQVVGPVAAAMVTALYLAACTLSPQPPGSCAEACGNQHPQGLQTYNRVSALCLCGVHTACTGSCYESVCTHEEEPSDACLPCVQTTLASDGCTRQGHFGLCLGDPECSAYIACLEAC
jgi:hypothetical protein